LLINVANFGHECMHEFLQTVKPAGEVINGCGHFLPPNSVAGEAWWMDLANLILGCLEHMYGLTLGKCNT
jgi:hypothetical protein